MCRTLSLVVLVVWEVRHLLVTTQVCISIFLSSGRIFNVSLVPIYDARKSAGFYETVSDIEKLNCIKCEVPPGSCVVVAYTLNTWGKSGPTNVSFNVRWVMLLGVPGSSEQK